jgi:hypothetical protein
MAGIEINGFTAPAQSICGAFVPALLIPMSAASISRARMVPPIACGRPIQRRILRRVRFSFIRRSNLVGVLGIVEPDGHSGPRG